LDIRNDLLICPELRCHSSHGHQVNGYWKITLLSFGWVVGVAYSRHVCCRGTGVPQIFSRPKTKLDL